MTRKTRNIGVLTKQQNTGQSERNTIYRYMTQNDKKMVFHKNNTNRIDHKYVIHDKKQQNSGVPQ